MHTSIKTISAVDFFEFRKNTAIFFSNGGVFQQSLSEKFIHLMKMCRAKEEHEKIELYLKSLFVSELNELRVQKAELYMWKAFNSIIEEEDQKTFTYTEASNEVKNAFELMNKEADEYLMNNSNVDAVRRFAKYRGSLIQYVEYLDQKPDEAEEVLEELSQFFLREINYIDVDPSSSKFFVKTFDENFVRWFQALGFNSSKELKDVTAFEFLQKNYLKMKEVEKQKEAQ